MDKKSNGSYRDILKATTLFGGVKVFGIIISMARSKVIALLIGAEGMGITSLFLSTINLFHVFTNLGLDKSGVKEIAHASENLEEGKLIEKSNLLMKLVWGTALLGGVAMLALSPILSRIAFGDYTYTLSFIWLSISLLFLHLTNGRLAVLQGLRKHKELAKANVVGNFLALLCTVPLYYFFGIDAIVPAIILATLITLIVTYRFSAGKYFKVAKLSFLKAYLEGSGMVRLGMVLSISAILTMLSSYLLQVFISFQDGTEAVGFYNAGYIILNAYLGLIFNAMATDYFPRLSSIADHMEKASELVFQQAHIALLLVTPIIVFFIAFAPFIIRLLYSGEFDPTIEFLKWGIFGMFFKATSFCIGYLIIAKGDSKLFIRTVISFNILLLTMNLGGYYFYGLEGLGVSLLVYFFIHFAALSIITYFRYGFYLPRNFYVAQLTGILFCGSAFFASLLRNEVYKYGLLIILLLCSIGVSMVQLNKKTSLLQFIKESFNKKR